MRVITLLGAVLFAGSVWLGACGPPFPGFCNGNQCSCHDGPDCHYECQGPGCAIDCRNVDNCDMGCGDACHWDCHDVATCAGACGDGCDAQCHNAQTCDLECGADCAMDCHDLESCSVTMISGEVHCRNTSDCDIRCLQPNGTTVPADNCGKDRWRCGC